MAYMLNVYAIALEFGILERSRVSQQQRDAT